jgi:hypothetical protein
VTDKSRRESETGRHLASAEPLHPLLIAALAAGALLLILAALCGALALVVFSARCAWEAGGR